MPLEDIANPLLRLPEMRTSGATLLSHAGEKPSLGAGQRMLFGIVSPVEFIFRETKDGSRTRGSQSLDKFYRLRQNSTLTKIWSFVGDQGWLAPWVYGSQNDDPTDNVESVLSYQTAPDPLISFYDSPGFDMPPHTTVGVDPKATKVYLLQSFQVWCEVAPSFSRGVFQASPAKNWNNMLCVQRDSASAVQWTVSSGALVAGRALVDRPLCD
jgi:hypothetical protein